jgi:xylulokinase
VTDLPDPLGHKYVLAIDLGTSGPKVGLVEDTGRVVAAAYRKNAMHLLPEGGAEQDPHEWWQSVRDAAREVIREAGVPKESIVAVGVTSQWSVIVPVAENGEPVMNAVSWMDTRGAPYSRKMTNGLLSVRGYGLAKLVKWIRLVGAPPTQTGADSLAHMLFIQHERPDVYARTFKFLEPMNFLNLKLTGRYAASQVTALPMILTDNRTADCRDYDPGLVKLSGIDPAKLPELLPSDGILGPLLASVALDFGLAPGTEVIMGVGDNHTAAIGAGAVRDYETVAVFGTSGFLSAHVPRKKTDLMNFIGTVPSPFPNRHLIFAEQGGVGSVLDAYLSTHVYSGDGSTPGTLPADAYDRMNALVLSAPAGSDGALFLPWFGGTLSPHEDPLARGGFLNLSYRTTRAHLTRAVLEGLSFNLRWLLGPVEKFLGRKLPYLRLAGGGAKSDVWAQILADVTGLPVHQLADPRNGNARGIAFLAFHRLGLLSLEQIPERVTIQRVYDPRAEYQLVYHRMFQQFLECQKRLGPVFHGLNRK